MDKFPPKKDSSGSSGQSGSYDSSSGYTPSYTVSYASPPTVIESEPPQWSSDSWGRVSNERQTTDSTWGNDFSQASPDVQRTDFDSSLDVGQDTGLQARVLNGNASPAYGSGQYYGTSQGQPGYGSSGSMARGYSRAYQPPSSTGNQPQLTYSLDPIPERLSNTGFIAPPKYDSSGMRSMTDVSSSDQSQPARRGGNADYAPQEGDVEDLDDDIQSRLTLTPSRRITPDTGGLGGNAAKAAALDPAFIVHHGNEFQPGRVFKIYWTEPKGQGNSRANADGTDEIRIPLDYGEVCYSSIRRFVIGKALRGHCLCLPILTYGQQATTKRGVKAQDHAIVYSCTKGSSPSRLSGEKDLRKRSIGIEPLTARDKLDPLSRLNYAKIYTVEYNVKVCFIGAISEKSVKYFNRDWNLTHALIPTNPDTEYSDEEPEAECASSSKAKEKPRRGGKHKRNK